MSECKSGSDSPTEVYVVLEDGVDTMSRIRGAFNTKAAAEAYVSDPTNLGHLVVKHVSVESEYDRESGSAP